MAFIRGLDQLENPVMAIKVSASEAKTHLLQLLDRVAKSERFVIARHGVPIADILPIQTTTDEKRREAIERLTKLSEGKHTDGAIREMIEGGWM